ncbi:hypothetical protein HK105_208164, partial [Polyrhizophydium stewartii]
MSHSAQLQHDSHVTIGKPIQNASCYILDSQQRQVPIGVVGEMCLGGIGVSRGYINLPDLTAQRFVPDPFSPEPGARMFRTGDLGRLLPDGNFEILGRMDDQVKLKGYRIELDEVAAAMMRHPRVSAAAAVVKDKTHLVGFVVPADVDHDELRDVVAAALPAYMVPAVFVGLAVMPTNTNGKTDKKALAAMHVEIVVDALQTDTERALAAVWSQVLGVQVADIGRATSFFALGGDSISAIRLVAKAKQQGLTLSSALIFKAPTLAKMALAATVTETRAAVSSAPVTGSVALTPIQHMFFAHDWINISHFNQSFVVKPRDTLDIAALTAAIARLAEHHDMLRARFAQGDDGVWSQTLLPPSPQTDTENVLAVVVESDDDASACIREAQESLLITHGPLLAVRLLHMHDGSQRLFFGIHHLVIDFVSWQIIFDDLETLLCGRPLAPKTLSFQAWAERMAAHAATLDAAPWRDLIGDHTTLLATQPPATGVPVRSFHARAVLDDTTSAQLDAANEPFNTNIQELVLAALVLSLADVAGCASSPAQLCIELEGHGREPFAADLDVSSTVGWFTSVFPVAFSASTASDIGAVVRQVKHKIRSVQLKGLSYGMIKHLAPPTADNAFVKAHGRNPIVFNYFGRFQSLEGPDAFFQSENSANEYEAIGKGDRWFHPIMIDCVHDGPRLVLSATVEDWIVSEPTMQAWLDRWQVWMQRVVAHCVDPATHGGRTVSDVPLMASQAAVEQAEAELAAVLSLRARDIVDMYPVTPLQAGFLSAMMRDQSEYTVQAAFDVTGNMDVQRLRAAWHAVAMAHPIVRTVFVSTPSGLVQVIAKDDRTEWTELDGVWSADDDALQAATAAFMAADRARGFSMASASFHRFTVARVADGRMRVFWTQHHSVIDGWSGPLLLADLMRACAGVSIDAKRVQFRDHVEWLQSQDAAASEQFWRESLAHAADAGRLAPPKPRESELTGAKYGELQASVELPHLAGVCKAHGITTSTLLRLAWALVLRHFTRSEHVLFGSVVSGRDGGIDGIDEIVGVLINTIAVPAHLPLDASIAIALSAMHSFSGDAIGHSHVGLVDVQRAAGVSSSNKLFDTIIVFENHPKSDAGVIVDFKLKPISVKEFVDQPLSVLFVQQDTTMQMIMAFETATVPKWFAASMADKLADVLSRLCSATSDLTTTNLADIDSLTDSQQAAIARFSHGERVALPFSLVHHGFEARAKQHPDWRAVEHGDAHLSYGDLDACGCALAAALASHGVQRGSRVAVVMQRSIEFVVALVGVLKAGAAIVPVDSSFPADRIQFMLDDASVCAIVTTASEADRIAQLSVGDRAVVVADARALLASGVPFTPAAQHMATGDDDFAIIYTSGTTGRPKGVPLPHKGAANVAITRGNRLGCFEGARMAQFMAIGFDGCQWEIWTALSHGATLVLREQDAFKTVASVTSLFITPTGLSQIGHPESLPNLVQITVGGEACPKELKDLWAPHVRFNNAYGPTEISIISHIVPVKQDDDISLGAPIPNISCYVTDSLGHAVPVGVVGEMCLGGIGVSRGYLNLPDMTAQRFVPDPFSPEPGARMFRTGDLGRLLPDGNFEILGRMDDQVKLKGYRIELDEVAAAMMRHPRVSAAAAVVKDKTHLVGFVVPADVDHDELRDVVAAALPAYMVPAVFVGLAVMPTNTNGKTDKKALAAMHVEIAVDALQTDTERALAAVWSQVLGVQVADIGRATSFFALGGDSISAIKAAAAMQRAGISITVPQLFKAQTVARVAALADAADAHDGHRSATEWPAAVLSDETLAELAAVGDFVDAYPATPLQAGMVAATMQDARAYVNQVPLRATRTMSLESLRGALRGALRAVVQHHAILRTSFVSTVAGGIVQVVRASADAAECVVVAAPLAQHLAADKARGMLLSDASWIRAALVCDPAGSAQHVVVTIHHALYDGWSLPMIMRDLAAALDGHALEPRPAFRTVVDFIAAQDAAATEAFWTQQLVGLEPAQPLSLGHSVRTGDEDAPLAQACSTPMAELQRAAQRAGVTVAVVLKAAWAATLSKFTRSHDVVFGEVLANRDIAVGGADRIVGPLLNTVPCRVVLDDAARAADLVASMQAQHGAVLSHSHAALVDVQRWAGIQGDGKLFNTLFVFENLPDELHDLRNEKQLHDVKDVSLQTTQSLEYSFELIVYPNVTDVLLSVLFDHSHLSRSQAASILAEFDFGVQQLVSALSDKAAVESLWTLSPAQHAMIARFSHGERVALPFSLMHHGFEARAKQHPDWRAVEHGDAHLSYGDLDACGSALAASLASHGVQRGSRVAVVMQRSIEFVVALVGVLKAGAAIVPVDSSFPADRIQFMLDDASVCAIVTTASEAGRIAQLSVGDRAVVVADARALLASGVSFTPAAQHTATGDDDAFIVYTSGSTGKPKGVPVPQKGAVNVVALQSTRIGCVEHARVAQFMAIGFDVCQWEIWGALSNGSVLVLRDENAYETFSKVSVLHITPTGLAQIAGPQSLPNITHIAIGGEACPNELKDLWANQVVMTNVYGPTETSIISHAGRLEQGSPVTVGRQIANNSCYVLDSKFLQVPIGVVGELFTSTPGVQASRGYLNLPEMTAQRFVPDPFSPEPGARMFRTGDLGRLLPDGNFEILGRMDDQVKLKGYRIELDEVAAAMMRHPRVSAAAAVVKDKTHLVGFVVPADVDHDELRDVVAAALPAYMVPAVFVGLAVMPTNTNGKTDKKALAAMHVEIVVDALQTDTERALAAVWSQVLGVQVADIGRATSFFALGGDSISAIRLVAKAKQQGLTLSSALIFKAPTLAKMALAATVTETRAAVSSAPVTGSVALTPIQHMFFAHDWINISHFNQSFVVKPRDTLDIAALTAAIARLAEHHDMLRARFAQGDDGVWSQTLLPPSPQTDTENVLAVVVESDDDASACIREAQESLLITHGPLLAVRLLHMHDGSQRLFFGIHHLVIDLVSWQIILDDLETLLCGRPLAPKTLSFQAWAERMAAHAATLDAAPWRDLIGDHTTLLATQPPATGVPVRSFHARAVLDDTTTAQLDAANEPFNTNIQELVLAALVLSLADVAGCASSPAQLCIELEGHGREPFAADLDVSSTVGWFTSVFPVAFSASTASDIGAVVRQVKHKIRSVQLKGLSYGMIKHLAPPTADNAFVKAHGRNPIVFNYLGRFQSLEGTTHSSSQEQCQRILVNSKRRQYVPSNQISVHDGPRLVLSATVEDWIVSEPTMQAWLDRWQVWMQRVVAHCVDPATHGGRTVSDVPLMASQAAVEQAEAELAAVLSLRARDIVDMYPVTPLQAGFLSAMMRDQSEYTVQAAFDVTGNMDVQRLRAAWHAVAMAHPIVRTVFVSTPSGLVQVIAKDDRTEWTELDGVWSADDDALQAATAAFMAADRARGFSMASASFHRFTVARVADGRMRVFWTQHHSVIDGWSGPLLLADLMRACAGVSIDAKRVQFRDHVEWLQSQDAAASEQFWRESLAHAADAGRLAPPKPRESELTGAKYGELQASVELPHLAGVCKAHGITTSTLLRLAWALVLRHFTRSEHVLFGSVVSGRDGGIDGIDEIVGVLINTIAVPAHLPLDASIAIALSAMHSFSGDAIGHSHVGLVDVQRAAGVSSSSKLFDTIMVFENYPSSDPGVALDFNLSIVKGKEFVDQPVSVAFIQQDTTMQMIMAFETATVPKWFAASMADKLADVLSRLCSATSDLTTTNLADIDSLTDSQQAAIARFSHGERVALPFSLVHHGFEARAKQHPDWRAVEHGDAHLSYGDLDACGCALAAALASHGVQRGSRVAVVMQRSIEFVVALVGVLKAGATIVPVDSSFPADRIQFMLDDASVCAIVTTASEADRIAQLSVGDRAVVVADARALLASGVSFTPSAQHTATADDDAFIVYTSGSTGRPKGVPVPHKGAANVAITRGNRFGCFEGARMAQFMAIGFDGCQWETWSALSHGATLVLREQDAFKTVASVTSLFITPTGLSQIGHPESLPSLVQITVGGEACPKELKDLWAPHVRFNNAYGPTEISFISHIVPVKQDDDISLGAPIPNMSCYVTDSLGHAVPVGVVGEMCLGGIGVSRGYINLPDLTAQRFVPDPFSPEPGARMFRTGDLGRLLPDGNVEIIGRMDDQVKLKGYRIELDEVAAAMMRHPRVSAAAAVVKDKTHLVGFVVPADVDHDELRDVVAAALPAYMVPAVFVGLAVMPTNTNGKTDKKALAAMHVEIAVDALQTDTERALAAVWSQVLGVQVADIGRATSFFALGGDSISAIRLVAKAKQQGLTLSSALIFKAPTLAKMALAATVTETRAAVSSAPVTGSVALTPIQHMFFAHDWINISHFNQSFVVTPRDTLDIGALTAAIARLAEHHDMLRARFAQGDDGVWSQTLLPPSPQIDAANVLAVVVESDDDALACIREAQESLSITHGPLLAVRLLHMHDGSQRLFFGIHHLVVDLVSWRVLLDDLETLLRGRQLAPKTLSFQTWAARMAAHAATINAAPWRDLIGDHTTLLATQPPATGVPVRSYQARAVLDEATTAQLDAANEPFNTNIQELVLAALVLSLADVAGCASSPAQLCIELEGHGREPFAADLDVSSTVGWFTSVFPVAFSASTASDIGAVVRQVKHKIRSVPLKGLSYGMIKHLAPPTADNAFVKAHGGHAVAFNYLGRFQSLEADDSLFAVDNKLGGWEANQDERMLHAIELNCEHVGPRLVLSATIEDWIVSEPTMQAWLDRWQVWMQRVVAHCVDPATHGGRTVADVPLMASQAAVEQAEAELAAVLSLRARDIFDMYPVTPLQAGMLAAMMRDPSEYTVQAAFDVTGNMDVQRLRAAWHAVAMAHPIVRTVFVSTPSGLVQAVAKDDRTEWTELDGVWSADDDALQAATDAFMAADRARGFSMASASFHRFTVARVDDGRMRVFWTQHHSVADGWSTPLMLADLMRACAGVSIDARLVQFRDHVEWLQAQDAAVSEQFWRESLAHAADAGKLAPPKPRESELTGAKYGELHASVDLPHLAAVCKTHGVTTSTVLRLAWGLVLRHFTRSEHVVFGSVVSGRDGGIDGIDEIVGVLINTIAVPAHLPLDTSVAAALAAMHSFSVDAIAHSHVGLVDAQRAAGVSSSSKLFDTIMVFENYPSSDAGVTVDFVLEPVKSKEFVDEPVAVDFELIGSELRVGMTNFCAAVPSWFAEQVLEKLLHILTLLNSENINLTTTTISDVDSLPKAHYQRILQISHGPSVPSEASCIHHAFEAQAAATHGAIALDDGFDALTYAELDARANQLAHTLQSLGAGPEVSVAVIATRSIEFVVGILGVLKAGAAFVPIEASTPQERIRFMLESCGVPIVATTAEAAHAVPASLVGKIVHIDDLPADAPKHKPADTATARSLAYTIFTSGTTGTPKGVLIEHGGIHTRVKHHPIVAHLGRGVRMSQTFTVGFDACLQEVFSALTTGATLVLRSKDKILDMIAQVDVLSISPSGLQHIQPGDSPRLKCILLGAEACPQSLVDRWADRVALYSDYGPTEVTIMATCTTRLAPGDRITLGRPLANTAIHILDDAGRRVPPGVKGRLFIGGVGIARGYLGRPDLTTERFVADIGDSNKKMYDTGDVGRWTHDGQIEYLGRSDDQ